jgi:hypothetical protein
MIDLASNLENPAICAVQRFCELIISPWNLGVDHKHKEGEEP